MVRLLLATCLCLAPGLAFAVDPQVDADTAGQECPHAVAKAAAAKHANSTPTTARPATTPAAHAHAGGGGENRIISPRWHSMLPGMFR